MQSLRSIDLSDTSISDEGLARLTAHKKLRRLYLAGTQVTAAGVAAFRKRHPGCLVSWDGR